LQTDFVDEQQQQQKNYLSHSLVQFVVVEYPSAIQDLEEVHVHLELNLFDDFLKQQLYQHLLVNYEHLNFGLDEYRLEKLEKNVRKIN